MDDGMDKDLAQKLNDLLNSPDSMQKIQAAMSALGMGGSEEGPVPSEEEEEEEEEKPKKKRSDYGKWKS